MDDFRLSIQDIAVEDSGRARSSRSVRRVSNAGRETRLGHSSRTVSPLADALRRNGQKASTVSVLRRERSEEAEWSRVVIVDEKAEKAEKAARGTAEAEAEERYNVKVTWLESGFLPGRSKLWRFQRLSITDQYGLRYVSNYFLISKHFLILIRKEERKNTAYLH